MRNLLKLVVRISGRRMHSSGAQRERSTFINKQILLPASGPSTLLRSATAHSFMPAACPLQALRGSCWPPRASHLSSLSSCSSRSRAHPPGRTVGSLSVSSSVGAQLLPFSSWVTGLCYVSTSCLVLPN